MFRTTGSRHIVCPPSEVGLRGNGADTRFRQYPAQRWRLLDPSGLALATSQRLSLSIRVMRG